jgi:nitrate/TMAO reductase-like tetraheme cytochrome c subunit
VFRHLSRPVRWALPLVVCLLPALFVVHAVGQKSSTVSRSPHGELNLPCQNCHTSVGWKPIRAVPEFDHNQTKYPLRGLHQGVACTQCHAKPVFSNTGSNCADCHADIHRRQMGANCEQCHTVKGWNIVSQRVREHENRFPLIGGHAGLDCADCHKSAAVGQFQGLSTQCYSCHQSTFQQATVPNHVTSGFSTQCEQCHNINNWLGAKFDHAGPPANFPLTGMHATLDCTACHVGGKYKGTPATCVGCHLTDFQKASNPNHIALGLPQTCQFCHTTAAWSPASFNHDSVGFPLTGGHAKLQCDQCHTNGNFNLTTTACVSCHLKDYTNTNNPSHVSAGFPQQCQVCHSTSAWTPATFNHNSTTFPLTGAHTSVSCANCHKNNNYTTLPTNCYGCHSADYTGTNNPNHVTVGFPQQCEICHSTTNWTSASFNHASTGWPLTGAHTNLQCSQCHGTSNYNLTNTACVACHLTDFQKTNNPNHIAGNFPQQCDVCHNTSAWTPATFNHNNTSFPLTGAHTSVPCASCHVNNNYTTVPTDCYSCHKADYTGTTNPNHVATGFPTTCATCHSTTSWAGAVFNHTWFNVNHGNANGVCATCHTNSSDYSIFQCTNCHTKSNTDSQHRNVGGYVYNSVNCYQCHKNGGGG